MTVPVHPTNASKVPHASDPGGWAVLIGFLAFTVFGIALYLTRLWST